MSRTLVSVCLALVLAQHAERSSASDQLQFVCSDGSEIDLVNACDGTAHCLDSSDETSKLCHRLTCPLSMFKCAYGACIPRNARCNGVLDCVDGTDEFYCDDETVCSDHRFRCSTTKECIPHRLICDGLSDCSDGSDETPQLCKDYLCPENTYQCAYGGCIPGELVCDKVKDCVDGSDESNHTCPDANCVGLGCQRNGGKLACSKHDFACKSGDQCVPLGRLCDGAHQCRDGSDESLEMCKHHKCTEDKFRCDYGGCIPARAKCDGYANCRDWSDESQNTCGQSHPLPEGACRLPLTQPGISYSVVNNCERCRAGEVAPEYTTLEFTCHDNTSSLIGQKVVHCQANKWVPEIPSCPSTGNETIKCPAIRSAGTKKRCEAIFGSTPGWISCDESAPIGSLVSLECLDFYKRKRGSSHVKCLHDGTWSQSPLMCEPICGVRASPSSIALIVNGWDAPYDEPVPWHASLFSHENGAWTFFCGATLISENIVLTAGHCVWKTNPETIRVVLGSNSSKFDDQDSGSQVRSVTDVKLQGAYQDHEGNYGSDIAILILNKPATIHANALPACIDWKNQRNVDNRIDEIGIIVGMGMTETEQYSTSLKMTTAKLVSGESCREHVKRDFRKYLTFTSFCAGWANGTGVCNGDSGGGFHLQVPNSDTWEIHGIVSLSPRKVGSSMCDPEYYTVFTKISVYADWIKQIIDSTPAIQSNSEDVMPNKDDLILE